jgi:hypothetical protein
MSHKSNVNIKNIYKQSNSKQKQCKMCVCVYKCRFMRQNKKMRNNKSFKLKNTKFNILFYNNCFFFF